MIASPYANQIPTGTFMGTEAFIKREADCRLADPFHSLGRVAGDGRSRSIISLSTKKLHLIYDVDRPSDTEFWSRVRLNRRYCD